MLLWILGEVVVGLLVSGIVTGLVVGAARQSVDGAGAWVAVIITVASILASVVVGERMRRRRLSP